MGDHTAAPSTHPAPARARDLPFAGRDPQLATLRDRLASAVAGHGGIVLVDGEPGVGKTRLVQHLADLAARDGWQVASGIAFEFASGGPWATIADALASLVRRLDRQALVVTTRGLESALAQVLPFLEVARGTAADPDGTTRTRILWHVTQWLERLGQRAPLLLTIDNLQWTDAASLELLHFLPRHLEGARVLVVITGTTIPGDHDAPVAQFLRATLRPDNVTHLPLAPFAPREVLSLLEQALGALSPGLRSFARLLHDATRGNAFLASEIVRQLVAEPRRPGQPIAIDLAPSKLPTTIHAWVDDRLATLSPLARELAEGLAIAGARTDFAVMERLVTATPGQLADAIAELVARGLVVPAGERAYDFAHPVVRQVVVGHLDIARAHAWHLRVLHVLEEQHGADAPRQAPGFAAHLEHVVDAIAPRRALEWFTIAGRDALARHADHDADRYLARALALVDAHPTIAHPREVAALLPDVARARQRVGLPDESRALLTRARDLAATFATPADVSSSERALARLAVESGAHDVAVAHLVAAEAAGREGNRLDLVVHARLARAAILQSLGQSPEGRALVEELLTAIEAAGDPALLALAHRSMVLLYAWTGPAARALEHGQVALAHAATAGSHEVAWSVHWALGVMAGMAGDGARVGHHRVEAERLADVLDAPALMARTAELGVEFAVATGDWDQALSLAGRAMPAARVLAPRTLLPRLQVWTATVLIERDEARRARDLLDEAWSAAGGRPRVPVAEAGAEPHAIIPAAGGMASWFLREHRFEEAVAWAECGLALADRLGHVAWAIHRVLPVLAESLLWLQRFDEVERVAYRLRAQSMSFGHTLGLALADAAIALLGRFRDGRTDAHAGVLAVAERLEAVPLQVAAARLRLNAAQLLAMDGDREGALAQLKIVHERFERMGAVRELRITRREMRALGRRPDRRQVADGPALTEREQEVAALVAQGMGNKQVAARLDLTVRTVENHLARVFRKLGVSSRAEVAVRVGRAEHR